MKLSETLPAPFMSTNSLLTTPDARVAHLLPLMNLMPSSSLWATAGPLPGVVNLSLHKAIIICIQLQHPS